MNEGIKIHNYVHYDTAALKNQRLIEISPESFNHNFLNLLWACAHVFKQGCVNWSGYISTTTSAQQLPKSTVTSLPITNLPFTNMTALHSLLRFVND